MASSLPLEEEEEEVECSHLLSKETVVGHWIRSDAQKTSLKFLCDGTLKFYEFFEGTAKGRWSLENSQEREGEKELGIYFKRRLGHWALVRKGGVYCLRYRQKYFRKKDQTCFVSIKRAKQ